MTSIFASALPAYAVARASAVVIVGGGIVGSSIAYHLRGPARRDVVLLKRGGLTTARPGTPTDSVEVRCSTR